MENAQIYEQLTEVFRDVLNEDRLRLTAELTAADVPKWDSFNHINIVVASEEKFGIKFKTAELEQLRNVGQFVDLIDRKLRAKLR